MSKKEASECKLEIPLEMKTLEKYGKTTEENTAVNRPQKKRLNLIPKLKIETAPSPNAEATKVLNGMLIEVKAAIITK